MIYVFVICSPCLDALVVSVSVSQAVGHGFALQQVISKTVIKMVLTNPCFEPRHKDRTLSVQPDCV